MSLAFRIIVRPSCYTTLLQVTKLVYMEAMLGIRLEAVKLALNFERLKNCAMSKSNNSLSFLIGL